VEAPPLVADLDRDGAPEVIFGTSSFPEGGTFLVGVLRPLRGRDGSEVFTVTDPAHRISTSFTPASADLDGDGLLMASVGPQGAFLLNGVSFLAVIVVVWRWRRPPRKSVMPAERIIGAMKTTGPVYGDVADPARYLETFPVESWTEHLRQHERVMVSDREVQSRVNTFHTGKGPPVVSHLLARPGEGARGGPGRS